MFYYFSTYLDLAAVAEHLVHEAGELHILLCDEPVSHRKKTANEIGNESRAQMLDGHICEHLNL